MKETQAMRTSEIPAAARITIEYTAGTFKQYLASHGNRDNEELCSIMMEISPRSQSMLYQWMMLMLKAWADMPVKNDPSGPVVDASRKICELMGWIA